MTYYKKRLSYVAITDHPPFHVVTLPFCQWCLVVFLFNRSVFQHIIYLEDAQWEAYHVCTYSSLLVFVS